MTISLRKIVQERYGSIAHWRHSGESWTRIIQLLDLDGSRIRTQDLSGTYARELVRFADSTQKAVTKWAHENCDEMWDLAAKGTPWPDIFRMLPLPENMDPNSDLAARTLLQEIQGIYDNRRSAREGHTPQEQWDEDERERRSPQYTNDQVIVRITELIFQMQDRVIDDALRVMNDLQTENDQLNSRITRIEVEKTQLWIKANSKGRLSTP